MNAVRTLTALLALAGASGRAGAADLPAVPIGPPGGSTQTAAVSFEGQTLYVGATSGLFRSADQGESWTRLPSRPPGTLAQLAVDAGDARTVYAATSQGLFQSLDAGASWLALNGRFPGVNGCDPATQACGRAVEVASDPNQPGAVLAAFADAGLVFRSDDAGRSWSRARTGLDSLFVTQLVPVPAHPGTFYAASNHGVRVSHDGGATWRASGLQRYPVISVAGDAGRGTEAYAVTSLYGGQLISPWRREAESQNFHSGTGYFPGFFDGRAFTADPFEPGTVYAAALGGTLRGFRGGDGWQRADPRPTLRVLPVFGAPGTLFSQAGPDEGTALLRSTDFGVSWEPAGVGVAAHSARQVTLDPNRPGTIYVRTARSALRRSDDGGRSWRRIFEPQLVDVEARFALDPFDSGRLYLATPEAILRSTDRGAHWDYIRIDDVEALAADPKVRGTLYALSTRRGFLRSRDGGDSWEETGALNQVWTFGLIALPRGGAPALLYASTLDREVAHPRSRLWRSEDGGDSWRALLTLGSDNAPITALAPVPGQPRRLFAGFANLPRFYGPALEGGVYRTRDGGTSWRLLRLDAGKAPALSLLLDPADPDHLYAGSTRGRIFASRNAGDTWTLLSTSLPEADVRDLQLDPRDPHLLYAALDGASVYRLELERLELGR